MKITVCGLAGTGTSTVGEILSKKLGYSFFSSGYIFRQKALEMGMDLNQFEQLCKKDEKYDKELDRKITRIGKENDNIVVESRLAWYFIPDSFKVKLYCDDRERIKRVAQRDKLSKEEARNKTKHREDLIRERYKMYYRIDQFDADENFNLVIDATKKTPDEISDKIIKEMRGKSEDLSF